MRTPAPASTSATPSSIEPGGAELTVVGLAADAQLNVGPTLFVTYDTYVDAVAARNPDAGEPLPNALGVVPDASTSLEQLVPSINAQSDDLDALTRDQAADEAPGVAQVRQSFRVIFALYGLVVPLVTGLFFLIVTVQKAASLTLLRAIGTPGRRLVSALLVQVLIIDGLGLLVGIALYTPLTMVTATALGLRFETSAVVGWSVTLLMLGVFSSLLAARRVLAYRSGLGNDGGRSSMRLALRELRRRPGRFVTATVILTLVAVLVMFLGGLLDGLIRSSTDAVQAQDGDLLVFSSTAQSSFLRSRIDGDTALDDRVGGRRRRAPAGSVSCNSAPGSPATDLATWPRLPCSATSWRPSGCPSHRRRARCTPTTCSRPTASRRAWRSSSAQRALRSR